MKIYLIFNNVNLVMITSFLDAKPFPYLTWPKLTYHNLNLTYELTLTK